ncbi:MAG: hypothetical protein ACE5E6_10100, partial [Phycisphaerae bacterium]
LDRLGILAGSIGQPGPARGAGVGRRGCGDAPGARVSRVPRWIPKRRPALETTSRALEAVAGRDRAVRKCLRVTVSKRR